MADISRALHEHEQRIKGKTGKTEKPEKPKKAGGKKPASRGELILMIQRAELASVRHGQDGQIWFNPKNGEIWCTHFSPADNYLPSAAAEKFVLLWETYPKKLDDVLGPSAARLVDDQETEFFSRQLSSYVRGKFSHKFNPEAIADRLIEKKIKPALDKSQPPVKEKAQPKSTKKAAGTADDGPATLKAACHAVFMEEAGLARPADAPARPDAPPADDVDRLWDALVSYIAFIDDLLTGWNGCPNNKAQAVLKKYAPEGGGWGDIPRAHLFDVLTELQEIYKTASPGDYDRVPSPGGE